MAEHDNQQGYFFMGFLIGGALGALAGIFFAPKSGKDLRSDIKDKGSEVIKDGKEIYADASTRAKEIIEEAKLQAKAEHDRIVAAGAAEVEQEVFRAKEQLRTQVSVIALAGAEKILGREIDAKAHNDLLEKMVAEI